MCYRGYDSWAATLQSKRMSEGWGGDDASLSFIKRAVYCLIVCINGCAGLHLTHFHKSICALTKMRIFSGWVSGDCPQKSIA